MHGRAYRRQQVALRKKTLNRIIEKALDKEKTDFENRNRKWLSNKSELTSLQEWQQMVYPDEGRPAFKGWLSDFHCRECNGHRKQPCYWCIRGFYLSQWKQSESLDAELKAYIAGELGRDGTEELDDGEVMEPVSVTRIPSARPQLKMNYW